MLLEAAALALSALPLAMTVLNLSVLRTPALAEASLGTSVLIPARDEEANIGACVASVLASRHIAFEVIVLDDGSTDQTAAIVQAMMAGDARLRYENAPPLPRGWNGKQHACHVLATLAGMPHLVFIDADVRLEPEGLARLVHGLDHVDLVSGVPRQITKSIVERLFVPMINVLILGYLPVPLMRQRADVGLGAGCGQMMAVRADAYRRAGGHAAIRTSLHDGLKLPRLFRSVGLKTDLVDGTRLAHCRMYDTTGSLLAGLLKNATEGMAQPLALPLWTALLIGGHVLPWGLLGRSASRGDVPAVAIAAVACALPLVARLLQARRCGESLGAVALHPFGVAALIGVQWVALARQVRRRPKTWRGRTYDAESGASS